MNTAFRAKRTRSKIHGTAARPRLSVHVSNRHIIAQIIDDDAQKTLAYATTVGSIDDNQLFYMQSRGLSAKEAGALLTLGYLSFIKDIIPNSQLQEYLDQEIESKVNSIC